jgi:hypothetical protein
MMLCTAQRPLLQWATGSETTEWSNENRQGLKQYHLLDFCEEVGRVEVEEKF